VRWSIGELARASGTTVRTVRHYDGIGLLSPSGRTAAGHRRYTERDLRRLYRVLALRSLGLSLEEIMHALDGSADDLATMRDRLAERRRQLGPDAVETARTEWARLVEELLPHVEAGTPVGDPRVRALVERWDAVGARFHDGAGPDTAAAARAMWHQNSAELATRPPWPADPMIALVAYVDRVRQAG
jgi:DNA-binding transcriptional MerR regulator